MGEPRKTEGIQLWLDDEGIVHGKEVSRTEVDLNGAKESLASIRALANGKRIGLLMDITELRSMSRDARVFFAQPAHVDLLYGVALIVRSSVSRAIGNVMVGLNRPAVPLRLFTDEKEALAWVRALMGSDARR